jgi:catechol 2,3-dioxygenase-like lactoylglutathione lyase family enzyme
VGEGRFGDGLRVRLDEAGEGLVGFALRTRDADALVAALRARGLAAADPIAGEGRDETTGAVRRWRNVMLPADATRGVLVFGIEHHSPADALPEAKPEGAPEACVSGIDHLVLRSEDPDATIRLYGEQLGLRLAVDRSFPQWGARLLFFRVGGVTVEVAAPVEPVAAPAALDHPWGISWRVADVGAARVRLAADGFDVSEARTGRRPGTRVCTVRGPSHGVATLLLEPAAAA